MVTICFFGIFEIKSSVRIKLCRVLVAKLFLFQTDLAVPVDVEVEFHRMAVAQAG